MGMKEEVRSIGHIDSGYVDHGEKPAMPGGLKGKRYCECEEPTGIHHVENGLLSGKDNDEKGITSRTLDTEAKGDASMGSMGNPPH